MSRGYLYTVLQLCAFAWGFREPHVFDPSPYTVQSRASALKSLLSPIRDDVQSACRSRTHFPLQPDPRGYSPLVHDSLEEYLSFLERLRLPVAGQERRLAAIF